MQRGFVAENDEQRERMKALTAAWSDETLGTEMPAGWTVAAILAHIGFWDARALYLFDKWRHGGEPSEADCAPDDLDWVNDAGKPLCLALPVRVAAELAVRLAEEADASIAALSDEMLEKIVAAGMPFNLSRAEHRRVHLDEIEALLTTRA